MTHAAWSSPLSSRSFWVKEITNRTDKEKIAEKVAAYAQDGDVIGVGSGSTAYLTILALGWLKKDVVCIPTSYETEWTCQQQGLKTTSLSSARPDWCFDGADEIDPFGNMIKGRGGAMVREKMVMTACKGERLILIDPSKKVKDLGEKCAVPVEVRPESLFEAEEAIRGFNPRDIHLRMAVAKDGPVITEGGNIILDVRFDYIAFDLDKNLSSLPGVVGTGLFMGFDPIAVEPDTPLKRG